MQVPAEATEARLQTVLALLRQTPGVVSAEPLTPAETARLLEPWLGSPLALDELPVPRLIDLRLDPNAPVDLAAMRRQLAAVVADARIDAHHAWLGGLHAGARPIRAVLATLIVASIGLVLASAIFAARTALTARKSAVELFHLLGADDGDIAWPFALRALRLGLLGGAIGAGAALLTVLFLRQSGGLVQLPAPDRRKRIGRLAALGDRDRRRADRRAAGARRGAADGIASTWAAVVGVARCVSLSACCGASHPTR